jgi:hypothetical protein
LHLRLAELPRAVSEHPLNAGVTSVSRPNAVRPRGGTLHAHKPTYANGASSRAHKIQWQELFNTK